MPPSSTKTPNPLKKRMLIIMGAIVLLLIVLLVLSHVLETCSKKKSKDQESAYSFSFVTPDYEMNVYEDNEYIQYLENGILNYTDMNSAVTMGYNREDAMKIGGDGLALLTEYIYAAIEGRHDDVNSCFSETYYQEHDPLDEFTMQKIVDVYIKKLPLTDDMSEGTLYYEISYRILDNNGTFRHDIDTGTRKQKVIISSYDGQYLIDSMYS